MALNTKIFVGSLPPGVKPQELRRLFENYGVVTECDVMNRCGFVHMETVDMAENAIKALNSTPFKGQVIVVEPGRPKDTAKKAKPMHFGDRNRSHGGGSGGSVAGNKRRRRNNRGNPEIRRNNEVMHANNNNGGNQNLNSEEALQSLQLYGALFLGMCKMLKPEEAGPYQQENNINMGSAGALTNEDQQPVNNINLPGIAKNLQGRRRGRRNNNKGGRGSFHGGSINSPNDLIRNKQNSDSGGPMRNNANKIQQKNVATAPYHKDGPRSNFNQNTRVQNRGSGFDNQGNFRNKNDDQSKNNDVWQVGSNFSSDRPQFSDNYTGNNMPTSNSLGGINSNNGNYGNNNIAQERFRGNNSANGNNSNGNFAMGNQDRRGFALPERQNLDYNGQQMASQQGNFRGGNQMPGRNFPNIGHSGQNNISMNSNQSSERIFNRRNDNFGAQTMNRMNNQQQSFGFDNQQINEIIRANTFGNSANGSFSDGGGGYDNFRSNFEGHFADSRNMNNNNSRKFQNDFPPLGSSGIDMMNRNQPRQNMMFTRRFN